MFHRGNEDDFLAPGANAAPATDRVVKETFGFVKSNDYILMKEETHDSRRRKNGGSASRFFSQQLELTLWYVEWNVKRT